MKVADRWKLAQRFQTGPEYVKDSECERLGYGKESKRERLGFVKDSDM